MCKHACMYFSSLTPKDGLEKIAPLVRSTPSTETSVSKTTFLKKDPETCIEMADYRAMVEKAQDEPTASCIRKLVLKGKKNPVNKEVYTQQRYTSKMKGK